MHPFVYGISAVLCWSTVATAFKLALAEVELLQLLFYATLTACTVLLAVVAVTHGLAALIDAFRQNRRLTLASGLLNPVIYYLVLFSAYDLLPAQVAMSINYTWAIVLTLMAIIFLKQQVIAADLIAAVICYGGVFVIATQGDFSAFSETSPLGLGLALLSTVIWASYWTLNIADKREPVVGLCLNFLVALPVTALLCATMSDFNVTGRGLAASTYVGVIEMAVAFLLWSMALKATDNASRINNLIFLSPFLSLLLISRVLGEPILPTTLAGLALIIGGLACQQVAHSQAKT